MLGLQVRSHKEPPGKLERPGLDECKACNFSRCSPLADYESEYTSDYFRDHFIFNIKLSFFLPSSSRLTVDQNQFL